LKVTQAEPIRDLASVGAICVKVSRFVISTTPGIQASDEAHAIIHDDQMLLTNRGVMGARAYRSKARMTTGQPASHSAMSMVLTKKRVYVERYSAKKSSRT